LKKKNAGLAFFFAEIGGWSCRGRLQEQATTDSGRAKGKKAEKGKKEYRKFHSFRSQRCNQSLPKRSNPVK